MVLTFTVTRGPLHRLASIDVAGQRVGAAEPTSRRCSRSSRANRSSDARVATVAVGRRPSCIACAGSRGRASSRRIAASPIRAPADSARPVAVRAGRDRGAAQTVVGDVTISRAPPRCRSGDSRAARADSRSGRSTGRSSTPIATRSSGSIATRVPERARRCRRPIVARRRRAVSICTGRSRKGRAMIVDRVLVSGNARTDAGSDSPRGRACSAGSPLGDDAIIESQRRLGALGLFRRVRIVELPHGASVTRDVLIDVEEAPATTLGYGGGLEAGRRLRDRRATARPRSGSTSRRAASFEISRRNLWGKNRSISLFTRVSLRPRDPAVDLDRSGRVRRLRLQRISRRRHLPRAAAVQSAGRPAAHRLFRAGDPVELQLQPARRASGIRASVRPPAHGERPLRARPHAAVRRQESCSRISVTSIACSRRCACRRSPDRCCATRATTCSIPTRGTVLGVDADAGARARSVRKSASSSRSCRRSVYRQLPRARRRSCTGVRVGLADGFERLATRLDADGEPILGPDGSRSWTRDDVARQRAVLRRRRLDGARLRARSAGHVLERTGRDPARYAQRSGVPDRRQRPGRPERRVADAVLEGAERRRASSMPATCFAAPATSASSDLRPARGFGLRYRSPLGPLRVDLGFNPIRRCCRHRAGSLSANEDWCFTFLLGQAF